MKIEGVNSAFRVSLNELFFLDTNVWFYLYYPQNSNVTEPIIGSYSKLFSVIAEEPIQTNLVQMSELINVVIRAEYRQSASFKSGIGFKGFRASKDAEPALQKAKEIVANVLKSATLRSGVFSPEELKQMVLDCDKADFNDIYFAHYCEKQNLTLITHDFDFQAINQNIKVLTANKKYLK